MSSLERGGRRLTADWLLRLSEGLDCHPCEILAVDAPEGLSRRERVILAYVRRLSLDQQGALLEFLASAAPGRRRRRDADGGLDAFDVTSAETWSGRT